METNLPSCFSIQFLEQLLKFLVNFTLLKYVKSQRSYGFLITKELIFGFQILDLKDHFSASLMMVWVSKDPLTAICKTTYIGKLRMIKWSRFDKDCKNESAMSTSWISFMGPFHLNYLHIYIFFVFLFCFSV